MKAILITIVALLLMITLLASCAGKRRSDVEIMAEISNDMAELERRGISNLRPGAIMTWGQHKDGTWSGASSSEYLGDLKPGESVDITLR